MEPTTLPPTNAVPAGRRRFARWWIVGLALLLAYPLLLVGSTYVITFSSGLPGGSNGPCDAYRHALASALVAYTLSPRCVEWVTEVMEGDADEGGHRMDAHNNRVGVRLASRASSLGQLLTSVRRAVDRGVELDAFGLQDRNRIVWLPEEDWANAWW